MGVARMSNDLARKLKEALSGKIDQVPQGWMSYEDLGKLLRVQPRRTREIASAAINSGLLERKRFRLRDKNGVAQMFTYFKEIVK